jgi:decaprenylphospho-beta-D-erythro-pentofuranosid-2-ulose 2-reductase
MTEGLMPAPLSTTPEAGTAVVVDAVRTRKELVWAPAPPRFGFRSCSGRVSSPSPPSH